MDKMRKRVNPWLNSDKELIKTYNCKLTVSGVYEEKPLLSNREATAFSVVEVDSQE